MEIDLAGTRFTVAFNVPAAREPVGFLCMCPNPQ